MKFKFFILILVIIGILLSGFLFYFIGLKPKEQVQEIKKNNLIISQSSVFGKIIATYLFEDRTFLKVAEHSQEPQCFEGELSSEEYNSFIEFIKSTNFLGTEMTQKDDDGLLCEAIYSVQATIDNESNYLSLPCVVEDTEATKKAALIMTNISEELGRITNASKQICKPGGFIGTYDMGSCAELVSQHREWYDEKLEYKTYKFSDLSSVLQKSLIYENAYIYAGPIDETIKSYHRMYYRIGDSCYFVSLSDFDGNLFKSYDEVLVEKK